MLDQWLIGRKISHTEISNANKELSEAVEKWRNRSLSEEKIWTGATVSPLESNHPTGH